VAVVEKSMRARATLLALSLAAPHRSAGHGAPPVSEVRGLKFEWFDGEKFEKKVGERLESKISSVFGYGAAGTGGARDNFSCRWTGLVRAPKPGTYELKAVADDGLRLTLDGDVVMNGWEKGDPQFAVVKFTKEPRKLVFEMREDSGVAKVMLSWRMEGESAYAVIPPSAFSQPSDPPPADSLSRPRGAGLQVTVFGDRELKKSKKTPLFDGNLDSVIDWNFDFDALDQSIGSEEFSIRWKGYIVAPSPGTYQLKVYADDGIRVKLDDKYRIDDWRRADEEVRSAMYTFDDQPHEIEVEFFEAKGRACISLHWSKDGDLVEEIIPPSAYFTDLASARASRSADKPKK
jgi:hypothetical protein